MGSTTIGQVVLPKLVPHHDVFFKYILRRQKKKHLTGGQIFSYDSGQAV